MNCAIGLRDGQGLVAHDLFELGSDGIPAEILMQIDQADLCTVRMEIDDQIEWNGGALVVAVAACGREAVIIRHTGEGRVGRGGNHIFDIGRPDESMKFEQYAI
ncbi:MAG: hypothetical protein GIW97_06305 [Candidatus Eremiobacteraeota bacterium]|nr:hypothetical protein [Candidatus Eremiobacteraeota bacterium]